MTSYRASRGRLLLYLCGALTFVGGGVLTGLYDHDPRARTIGWLCAVFFGLGIPVFLRQLFDGRPLLILDDTGLQFRGYEVLPWSEVESAEFKAAGNTRYLAVELRRPVQPLPGSWRVPLIGGKSRRRFTYGTGMFGAQAAVLLGDLNAHIETSRAAPARVPPSFTPLSPARLTQAVFKVRWSPRFALSRKDPASLGLEGAGSIEFDGDSVALHGRRPVFLGWTAPLDYRFATSDLFNVIVQGHEIIFAARTPDRGALHGRILAADAEAAQLIAAMLPVMQTESFQRLRQEHAGFAENLARLGARAWVTPTLVGLNALVFVVAGLGGAGWFAPNGEVMLRFGTNYGPMTLDGQWWRLISAVFLHFGLVHLALNMWALYNAGQLAERLYGSFHFLLLYLFAGLGGSLASLLWNPAVNSAGASGAIFGVYGGLVAFFSRGGNQVPASIVSAQRSSTLTFIGYNLFFGLAHQGIDNAAHIGGLGTGAVLGWLLARPLDVERRRSMGYAHLAVAALVGLGLLAALAWPSLHPYGVRKQERQYTHDLRWLEQQEDGLNARYNDMAGQLDAGKLSEGDFIRRLESDTIPTLDGMFARIEQDSLDAASPFYPQRQFLERYFGLRRDGFRLYLKGLKENDKALQRQAMDQFNKAKQLMQEEEAKRK